MPLLPGTSKEVIQKNHDQLVKEGYKDEVAWAIAYEYAGKSQKKKKTK